MKQKGQEYAEFFHLARDVKESLKKVDQAKRDVYRNYREFVRFPRKMKVLSRLPTVCAVGMGIIVGGAWLTGQLTGTYGLLFSAVGLAIAATEISIRRPAYKYSNKRNFGSEHAEFIVWQEKASKELIENLKIADGFTRIPQTSLSLKQKVRANILMRTIDWRRKRIQKFEQKEPELYQGTAQRRTATEVFLNRLVKEFSYDAPTIMRQRLLTDDIIRKTEQFRLKFPSAKGRHRQLDVR